MSPAAGALRYRTAHTPDPNQPHPSSACRFVTYCAPAAAELARQTLDGAQVGDRLLRITTQASPFAPLVHSGQLSGAMQAHPPPHPSAAAAASAAAAVAVLVAAAGQQGWPLLPLPPCAGMR